MRGWGLFFFLLFLLVIFAYVGWIGWTQYKARRSGLPPPTWKHYVPFVKSDQSSTNYPTPRSSGPIEWVKDQFSKLRNPRSAEGAYEGSGAGGAYAPARRGTGRGFEDDAWDTRVGGPHEDPYAGPQGGYAANYEEQELGLAATPGVHTEPYGGPSDYTGSRGRLGGENPFGDQHEAPSLRSVSPRPETDGRGHRGQGSLGSNNGGDSSPTGMRKSAFREDDMR